MPLPGTQPIYAAGKVAEAFTFDGSSIIEVPNGSVGQLNGQRSLAMWVKPAASNHVRTLVAGDGGFMFGLSATNSVRIQIRPESSPVETWVYVDPDVWTHLVVTLEPQGVTQTRVTLYKNGAFGYSTLLPGLVNNGTSFLIGGLRHIPQQYRGSIDELQIFSSALTISPIQNLYLAGGSGLCRLGPEITWTPAPMTYGASLSAAQLNATANVPGSFTYDQPIGTIAAGGHAHADRHVHPGRSALSRRCP